MDTVIQAVSHIHWTQQKSRNPADKHNDLLHERWGRRYFRELYFRRGTGEVWKSKKEMQQTFHYQKKRDPRTCKVQHEETRTWCASWYIHHRLLLFVWALRIWSPSRWINLRSYHGGVAVEVGHVKNPNKNPVAETCVAELGDELLCICPEGGCISPLSFLSRQTVRLSWVCKLAKDWEFKHVASSPLYAKTNGEAERVVQTAKNLLQKADDSAKLSWHTNPYPCGVERAHLSYFWRPDPMHPPLHYNVPPTELARNRGLETGEKQKKDEAKAVLWYLTKSQWVTPSKTRGASVGPKRKQASHSPCKTVKSAATLPCRGSRRCHKKKQVRTST